MDYVHKATVVSDCLMGFKKDESGWKTCKKSSDVIVSWRPSTEFPGNVYKGEGVVSGSTEKVWRCLEPVPGGLRVKWDNNVKKFELLEQVTEIISVCRTVTPSAAMGMIAPRDFVDVIQIKQYEDGTISSNGNPSFLSTLVCLLLPHLLLLLLLLLVQSLRCPPQSGFVRGFNHTCGCICVPISGEPNKTQVISFFQTDLGGLLPRSVVDSFFPSSMAEFYSNLAKAVKSLKDH
ncbi:hypothetical protein CRUP_003609 [Coryphaenoides rupestris]|nr:hypothetical protein CRUP_003609 [Coryphaenoides rupestris]